MLSCCCPLNHAWLWQNLEGFCFFSPFPIISWRSNALTHEFFVCKSTSLQPVHGWHDTFCWIASFPDLSTIRWISMCMCSHYFPYVHTLRSMIGLYTSKTLAYAYAFGIWICKLVVSNKNKAKKHFVILVENHISEGRMSKPPLLLLGGVMVGPFTLIFYVWTLLFVFWYWFTSLICIFWVAKNMLLHHVW